jgi:hypothetical protein
MLQCGELEDLKQHRALAGGTCVWSGKVNGENWLFLAQHKEHSKAAKSKELPSKFYKACPSRTAPEPQPMLQCGEFKDLKQCCALGFSRNQDVEALHDTDGSGMAAWSPETLEQISLVHFPNAKDLAAKQLHMVGCLCELVCNLALTPGDNASQLPGFETPLGVFGGADN